MYYNFSVYVAFFPVAQVPPGKANMWHLVGIHYMLKMNDSGVKWKQNELQNNVVTNLTFTICQNTNTKQQPGKKREKVTPIMQSWSDYWCIFPFKKSFYTVILLCCFGSQWSHKANYLQGRTSRRAEWWVRSPRPRAQRWQLPSQPTSCKGSPQNSCASAGQPLISVGWLRVIQLLLKD